MQSLMLLAKAVLHDVILGSIGRKWKSLGAIKTRADAYEALKDCLAVKHPKIRRAVVKAIGEFKKEESLESRLGHLSPRR